MVKCKDSSGVSQLLRIDHLSHSFTSQYGDIPVLNDISISLDKQEILCIVGLSGCGKTTLLKIIAGLETQVSSRDLTNSVKAQPTQVWWNGEVSDLATVSQHIAYMPQTSSLLPWLTVVDNIALTIKICRNKRMREARQIAMGLLEEFDLAQWAKNYPSTLSGGMASRISFLRANAQHRLLLLLDEPFGALDAISRERAQNWLEKAWIEHRSAGILITHSLSEAVALGDRVIVMGKRGQALAGYVDIDLPRPRDTEIRTSVEFASRVKAVTELLEKADKPS